jgi:hypothetical protein
MRTKTTSRTTIETIVKKYAAAYFLSIIYYCRQPFIAEICSDIQSTLAPGLLIHHGIILEQ